MSAYLAYHTSQTRMDDLRRDAEHHRMAARLDARPAHGDKPHRVLQLLKLRRAPRYASTGC
jgi:hypothetical protein